MTSEWFWHLGLRGILFWMHHFARLLDRTNFRIGISLKTTIVACCLLMILSGNGSGARSLKTRRHHSESETEMIMGDLFDQKISQILLGNWQKTSNANKFIASSMVWHSSCDTHQVYIYIYIYVHIYIYLYLYQYIYIYILTQTWTFSSKWWHVQWSGYPSVWDAFREWSWSKRCRESWDFFMETFRKKTTYVYLGNAGGWQGFDMLFFCFLFFCLKLRLQRRYVQQPKLLDMLMKV